MQLHRLYDPSLHIDIPLDDQRKNGKFICYEES